MRYLCRVCGAELPTLFQLVYHFERRHPKLLPGWYWVSKLHFGRRPGLWRVYRDLKSEGLAKGVRR